MALLRVNAQGFEPVLHGSPQPLIPALRQLLRRSGPVTVLLHGYKYQPGGIHCPHDHLFALTSPASARRTPRRVVSWPQQLGYGTVPQSSGAVLCFGWDARGSVQDAYAQAAEAGHALARLCQMIRHLDPDRAVQVFSHSMGARVALQALHHLQPGEMHRMVLMAAAEFASVAEAALRSPAGRACEVVHVTSRENDLYDFLLERVLSPGMTPQSDWDPAFGTHLTHLPNLRNILLDDPATLKALASLGFPIAPAERRICHWSPYLRSGVFPFYRAVLSEDLDLRLLDAALPPAPCPRWSRLVPAWRPSRLLSFRRPSSAA